MNTNPTITFTCPSCLQVNEAPIRDVLRITLDQMSDTWAIPDAHLLCTGCRAVNEVEYSNVNDFCAGGF